MITCNDSNSTFPNFPIFSKHNSNTSVTGWKLVRGLPVWNLSVSLWWIYINIKNYIRLRINDLASTTEPNTNNLCRRPGNKHSVTACSACKALAFIMKYFFNNFKCADILHVIQSYLLRCRLLVTYIDLGATNQTQTLLCFEGLWRFGLEPRRFGNEVLARDFVSETFWRWEGLVTKF